MQTSIKQNFVTLFLVITLGVLLCAFETNAQVSEEKYTTITGTGQSLYRIAIPPILSNEPSQTNTTLAQTVLSNDLTLIGLFKILNPKGFLANLQKEGLGIYLSDWINIGAQAVIKGRARSHLSQIVFDFYLYDISKGPSPVLSRSYNSDMRSVRKVAHKFADEVVKYFTNDKGIFNTKIAFASTSRSNKTSQIYVMDYDGFGVYKVSSTGNQSILPDWSSGGQLAYTSYLWRNPDLYVVSSSGGRASRISRWPGLNTGGAWSPSGNEIALTLSKDGNSEIYVINPKGDILRRLTNNPAIDTSPAWSWDGSRVAFVSNRGGSPQIYIMSSRGGDARRITFQGTYNQEPEWCPNKETPLVAFSARDENGHFDIFTVNVNSGELKRLTQGQGNNKSPSWAPNGRLIVFASTRGGLWVMNPDGLNQHQIYKGQAETPAWSKK